MDFASWDFQDKYREKLGLPAPLTLPPRRVGDNDRYSARGGAMEVNDRGPMMRGRGDDRLANENIQLSNTNMKKIQRFYI